MPVKYIAEKTKYGRLTATGRYELRTASKNKLAYFECICDCGNIVWIRGSALRNGSTNSCGCYRKEQTIKSIRKHDMSNCRLYRIWNNMRTRCNKKYVKSYQNYGERGIRVCEEWDNTNDGFQNFLNWAIENGYEDNLSIDRIDVNGNYEPSNCRWVTQYMQTRNKRNNRKYEINGKMMVLVDIARENGINSRTLQGRLNNGYTIEEALCKEMSNKRMIFYEEKFITPKEFSIKTGINFNTIMTRINKGYSNAEDLIVPDRNIFLKKKVNKYDLQGNYLETYESASEAARKNNCCKSGVIECCGGKKKKFKGFIYKYSEEMEN